MTQLYNYINTELYVSSTVKRIHFPTVKTFCGVATIRRLLKMISLFCRILSLL